MYGFSCTVYLVGKDNSYVGQLDRPWTRGTKGFELLVSQIGKEVADFLEKHAAEGHYDVGFYLESAELLPELASLPWWKMLIATGSHMVWREEVQASFLQPETKGGA